MKKLIRAGAVIANSLLASKAAALEIGDSAPEFVLQSTQGEISLGASLKQGPVALAFFYADFTPG
jgi:peroxiredoxin